MPDIMKQADSGSRNCPFVLFSPNPTLRGYNLLVQWSGRGDLNSRLLGPEPSALPGCATPRISSTLNHTETIFILRYKIPIKLSSLFAGESLVLGGGSC
jgi:hypothetical protein